MKLKSIMERNMQAFPVLMVKIKNKDAGEDKKNYQ